MLWRLLPLLPLILIVTLVILSINLLIVNVPAKCKCCDGDYIATNLDRNSDVLLQDSVPQLRNEYLQLRSQGHCMSFIHFFLLKSTFLQYL